MDKKGQEGSGSIGVGYSVQGEAEQVVTKIHDVCDAKIYWGDSVDQFFCKDAEFLQKNRAAIEHLQEQLKADKIVLLNQVHGIEGMIASEHDACEKLWGKENISLFEEEGDFIITSEPGVAIGVLTADCVPLVLIAQSVSLIAVVHAGWRGSVARIVRHVINKIDQNYGVSSIDLLCLIGPCARACCYMVGEECYQACQAAGIDEQFLIKREQGRVFDLVGFNCSELERAGVPREQIDAHNALCTICHSQYCSYRRESHAELPAGPSRLGGRNPTFVML